MRNFFPFLNWLPNYKKEYLYHDINAGLTVGIVLIPQGLAYAMIAGLPPVYGLYAALLPQIVYAFLGTSRQLAVGPVAMDSLLVASGLGALSLSGMEEYISFAICLALMVGVIQLILGLFKMGVIANLLSKPVISGFTSAAAIIIGLSQLKHLLGIPIPQSSRLHELLSGAFKYITEVNFYTLSIGLLGISLLMGLKRWKKNLPSALIVVFLGVLTLYLTGWTSKGVEIIGEIPKGLPKASLPEITVERVSALMQISLTVALIAFIEAISISKAMASKHNYEIDPNQELLALGSANIIGSFFQSYPTTGGFSRSAVNDQAGGKTGVAALVSAAVVALTLIALTPLFYYLPNAVLASIIMVAVFGLIDIKYAISVFGKQKWLFIILIATFLGTLFIGMTEGILLGVIFSVGYDFFSKK